jgi:hypothetical protein
MLKIQWYTICIEITKTSLPRFREPPPPLQTFEILLVSLILFMLTSRGPIDLKPSALERELESLIVLKIALCG